jgi:hypothetical protein
MTSTEIIHALNSAIDAWNSTANGAEYYFGGTTTVINADCTNDFSVITAVAQDPNPNTDTNTLNTAKCMGSNGLNWQFRVRVHLDSKTNPGLRNFFVGDPNTLTGIDFVTLLTHELGHAGNIGHCKPGSRESRAL